MNESPTKDSPVTEEIKSSRLDGAKYVDAYITPYDRESFNFTPLVSLINKGTVTICNVCRFVHFGTTCEVCSYVAKLKIDDVGWATPRRMMGAEYRAAAARVARAKAACLMFDYPVQTARDVILAAMWKTNIDSRIGCMEEQAREAVLNLQGRAEACVATAKAPAPKQAHKLKVAAADDGKVAEAGAGTVGKE